MARYVDGFLLRGARRRNSRAYRAMARARPARSGASMARSSTSRASIDDVPNGFGVPFPKAAKTKRRRGRGVLVDRLQVARASQRRQQEGHGGSAHAGGPRRSMPFDHDAHVVGRLQDARRSRRPRCRSRRRASCCIAGADRVSRSCSRIPAARCGRARTPARGRCRKGSSPTANCRSTPPSASSKRKWARLPPATFSRSAP